MSADGGTILTSDLPAAPAAPPPPAPDSAEAQVQAVVDGPPEWVIPKLWDGNKYKTDPDGYIKEYARNVSTSYRNAEKLIGGERVAIPKSPDDKEGWERVFTAMGRPDQPDKYEFKRPEKLPDGMEYDDGLETEFRQWAHINGLTKTQANSFYEGFVKRQVDRHTAWYEGQKKAKADVEIDLRREHGDKYEGFVQQAKTALATFGDPDYLKYLEDTGQGNDPRVIRAWGRIGKAMGGTTKLKGSAPPETAPADLDKAISEFRTKNHDALFTKDHPNHDLVVREYNKLFQMRYPEIGG